MFPRYDIGDMIEAAGNNHFRRIGRTKRSTLLEIDCTECSLGDYLRPREEIASFGHHGDVLSILFIATGRLTSKVKGPSQTPLSAPVTLRNAITQFLVRLACNQEAHVAELGLSRVFLLSQALSFSCFSPFSAFSFLIMVCGWTGGACCALFCLWFHF